MSDSAHVALRAAAWLGALCTVALLLFGEAWLRQRGLGGLATVAYGLCLPVMALSVVADARARFGDDTSGE